MQDEGVGVDAAGLHVQQFPRTADTPATSGLGLVEDAATDVPEEPVPLRAKDLQAGISRKEVFEHRLGLASGVLLALVEAFQGLDDEAPDGHQRKSVARFRMKGWNEVTFLEAFNNETATRDAVFRSLHFSIASDRYGFGELGLFSVWHFGW